MDMTLRRLEQRKNQSFEDMFNYYRALVKVGAPAWMTFVHRPDYATQDLRAKIFHFLEQHAEDLPTVQEERGDYRVTPYGTWSDVPRVDEDSLESYLHEELDALAYFLRGEYKPAPWDTDESAYNQLLSDCLRSTALLVSLRPELRVAPQENQPVW